MSNARRGSLEIPAACSSGVPLVVGVEPEHEGGTQAKRGTTRSDGPRQKKLILCFDGTGNKFKGNSGDSNILKIFRMLDRTNGDQSGIGTYITSSSLSHTSIPARVNSWCQKAKDSAVGTSFDHHVIGGYKFLMRYYSPGDEIYFFGFSRGAYTARFLAEMLDYVGLVTQGNEEMVTFAWKTFSRWQQRHGGDKKHQEKKELFHFMKAFRETFTRPVGRIQLLGLFDTVNSVPRFEAAWMQRSKFPYTARSTAKVIRHAVAIDERRAKFRQDLISQGHRNTQAVATRTHHDYHLGHGHGDFHRPRRQSRVTEKEGHLAIPISGTARQEHVTFDNDSVQPTRGHTDDGYDSDLEAASMRYRARSRSRIRPPVENPISTHESSSNLSVSDLSIDFPRREALNDDGESDDGEQDIEELWFPGGHADIGGGWDMANNEMPLSHPPLVWMVREARRAGLDFDEDKMRDMNCWDDELDVSSTINLSDAVMPQIRISSSLGPQQSVEINGTNTIPQGPTSSFKYALLEAATKGKIHDCLSFGGGLPVGSVITWRLMEYLPFKRMDLQPDGSWKPIRFPLPRGEVRDIPDDVKIHNSVLRRIEADPKYRPVNLIIGGGGMGVRVAPEKYGMGKWVAVGDKRDLAGEYLVKESAVRKKQDRPSKSQ
ncbi:hypothetical protein FGG08_002349 [Glutinoglossum americanum]|uniref:T6SS Phospholipase effector Tle1-like catalytic domain-containing protein n=1 Tax=Glutinoglossum americanum TaxID=1670608 RepID=A0A9P8IF91_9PEZI|nr:hypothetical protein FGG08_002349 [Glutinoglossum americanum]